MKIYRTSGIRLPLFLLAGKNDTDIKFNSFLLSNLKPYYLLQNLATNRLTFEGVNMSEQKKAGKGVSSFPGQFWLVVMFEFFERGSYYGMMSILSVYLTGQLHFAKESVGLIKGTIQPLLYFLPIISGALADRFGYRKTLMVAFSFLGMGYFLTSQAHSYALVFGALVVMGFGAGTFKPIISGTIAKVTDEGNSTLGFGIYYWSINLGAFLFPLILVPILKKMDWSYVIIASAIGTAAMLFPTFFFYKDPTKGKSEKKAPQTNLVQTLANAFEIIYSPVVLISRAMKKSGGKKIVISAILLICLGYSFYEYLTPPQTKGIYPTIGIVQGDTRVSFTVERDMLSPAPFEFKTAKADSQHLQVTIFKPQKLDMFADSLLDAFHKYPGFEALTKNNLAKFIQMSDEKVQLIFRRGNATQPNFQIQTDNGRDFVVTLNNYHGFDSYKKQLKTQLATFPILSAISLHDLEKLYSQSQGRSFFTLYVFLLIVIALIIISINKRKKRVAAETGAMKTGSTVPFFVVTALGLIFWFIPGLTMLGRIISFIIYLTVTSLFIIDVSDEAKFTDHAKFLLMIFLYSGFWIMYFQMFDSVLWYVQAYVDGTSLNTFVNSIPGLIGIKTDWHFDIEHVTVINAGTIILLQLIISNIVKHTKALPTMIAGIIVATIGMAILAVSTSIWIFLVGIILFSIGEMTAHPKFISYIGIIAPSEKKAMYMGYLFLYGVFGSSIGGILGAKLYVHFVDNLNQPRVLWIIFSLIGVATIVSLLLYNKFLAPKSSTTAAAVEGN